MKHSKDDINLDSIDQLLNLNRSKLLWEKQLDWKPNIFNMDEVIMARTILLYSFDLFLHEVEIFKSYVTGNSNWTTYEKIPGHKITIFLNKHGIRPVLKNFTICSLGFVEIQNKYILLSKPLSNSIYQIKDKLSTFTLLEIQKENAVISIPKNLSANAATTWIKENWPLIQNEFKKPETSSKIPKLHSETIVEVSKLRLFKYDMTIWLMFLNQNSEAEMLEYLTFKWSINNQPYLSIFYNFKATYIDKEIPEIEEVISENVTSYVPQFSPSYIRNRISFLINFIDATDHYKKVFEEISKKRSSTPESINAIKNEFIENAKKELKDINFENPFE